MSSISFVIKTARTIYDGISLIDSAYNAYKSSENRKEHICSIINRLSILILRQTHIYSLAKNIPLTQRTILKLGELACRLIELLIRAFRNTDSDPKPTDYVADGFLFSIFSCFAEIIDRSPRKEDGSNAVSDFFDVLRLFSEFNYNKKVCKNTVKDIYKELSFYLKKINFNPNNLIALDEIPEILHDDIVFSRYTCSINHLPIRDPVEDPSGHHLYERAAVYAWLEKNNTSPITRLPLTPEMLVEKPLLKLLIDNRLKFHQEFFTKYRKDNAVLLEKLGIASPDELQKAAQLENPDY